LLASAFGTAFIPYFGYDGRTGVIGILSADLVNLLDHPFGKHGASTLETPGELGTFANDISISSQVVTECPEDLKSVHEALVGEKLHNKDVFGSSFPLVTELYPILFEHGVVPGILLRSMEDPSRDDAIDPV
jgi:hypothetical protein